MDFRAKQIVPPRDWTVFEDLCLAIFRAEWTDPLALKHGRIGQPQHGVDVYGSPRAVRDIFYGVQCKGKDRGYGSKATVKELEKELAKADKFSPKLQHWIFATSASKEQKLQQAARELSIERKAKGLFSVTALGWEDIQSLLSQYPDVVEDFYPEHAYDVSGLLKALRELPSGEEVRELREQVKRLNEALGEIGGRGEDARWDPVSFAGQRDLGPALLGRPLGPADASACPRLQEVDLVVAQLRRAFSARLVGGPGSGKSVCAYQAAGDFASKGWKVLRLADATGATNLVPLPADDPSLLIVDDAHLMPRATLRGIEEAAGARRLVLSIHNGIDDGSLERGAIVLDSRRAVKTIAAELLAHPEQTLAAVRRADDDVGINHLKEPLERRIDHAVANSDRPWQFCFVLGGGWKRSKESADAARAARADLVLAAAAMTQVASRDAPLPPARLRDFCEQNDISDEISSRSIPWLVAHRLFVSETDCRCPHQRFAMVVLGQVLNGQDELGRAAVGKMLTAVVGDTTFPLAGLRILLHELVFLGGDFRRWTRLVRAETLEPLIARCWSGASGEERALAALMVSDLVYYVDGWFDRIRQSQVPTIANWISVAEPPSGYGLNLLLNTIRSNDPALADKITNSCDPIAIAYALSRVTPETADHLSELIKAVGWSRTDAWKSAFGDAFKREACVSLATSWPNSEPLHSFASFCMAIGGWDDDLALAMAEAFIPIAQKAFADNPVSAFHQLDDIAGHVLRFSDPLGIYVGKLAPNRRRLALGKAMCAALRPKVLASQLSATQRRDFQDATFFLGFLRKASVSKFNATVAAIDWKRIARTIGDDWTNLPHDAEIFLSVSYSNQRARELIAAVVADNLTRIDKFSPRVAIMMPEVAIRHIEAGKLVRLAQHLHFEFQFGAILIAQLMQLRPGLVDTVLSPFEQKAGEAFSGQNSSWYTNAATFVEVIREAAPASLQRMLSVVNIEKAEAGWADSLQTKGPAQDSVALLVDSALSRADPVGEMARRLRKQFRKRSVPKAHRRRCRFDEND